MPFPKVVMECVGGIARGGLPVADPDRRFGPAKRRGVQDFFQLVTGSNTLIDEMAFRLFCSLPTAVSSR